MKVGIGLGLFLGYLLLFRAMTEGRIWQQMYGWTRENMAQAARERHMRSRRKVRLLQDSANPLEAFVRLLDYSGVSLRFPGFTVELWCLVNILALAVFLLIGLGTGWPWLGAGGFMLWLGGQWLVLERLRRRNLRIAHEELPKLLDFLGNYSITAGEISGVFQQISRYMREPLSTLLENCSLEARTTGDVSTALRMMAEKVEHPRLKELIRNMEISIHYCADLGALVRNSRRTVREYQQLREERRGMLREAVINILLLLGMSLLTLLTVDRLVQVSVWQLLFHTLPGYVALAVVAAILVAFWSQLRDAEG